MTFLPCRRDAYIVDTDDVGRIQHGDQRVGVRVRVRGDDQRRLGLLRTFALEIGAHRVLADLALVDRDLAQGVDFDQDLADVLLDLLLVALLRPRDVEALFADEGGGHDEEDEHDEHHVEHRRDVDFGFVFQAMASAHWRSIFPAIIRAQENTAAAAPVPPRRLLPSTRGRYRSLFLVGRFQPGIVRERARATVSASAGASPVTTLPAPTVARSPIVTGATSAEFEPMNASSPIVVRCLLAPS